MPPDSRPVVDIASTRGWRLAEPLRVVPRAKATPRYAAALRRVVSSSEPFLGPLSDLRAVCTATGMVIQTGRLRGAAGGIEAIIAPLPGDRFHVVIDAEPNGGWKRVRASLREDLQRHRFRFRLAHELGHTFFYDRSGAQPRRSLALSDAEESFCDHFARSFLLPEAAIAECQLTPTAILRFQHRFDVSLETTVRALAAVHEETFFGLLVANGPRAPLVRLQWHSEHTSVPPRWWAADWLQGCLADAPPKDQHGLLGYGRAAVRCLWRALPVRGQVLVVAAD